MVILALTSADVCIKNWFYKHTQMHSHVHKFGILDFMFRFFKCRLSLFQWSVDILFNLCIHSCKKVSDLTAVWSLAIFKFYSYFPSCSVVGQRDEKYSHGHIASSFTLVGSSNHAQSASLSVYWHTLLTPAHLLTTYKITVTPPVPLLKPFWLLLRRLLHSLQKVPCAKQILTYLVGCILPSIIIQNKFSLVCQ